MATPGALANLDIPSALEQMANGVLMRQIAARWNCSKVAIYKRLSQHPDYPATVHAQADALIEQALEQVMECDERNVNIARARFDACHKWAQARNPAVWGQRGPSITINNNVLVLADSLAGDALELLDKLRTVSHKQQIGNGAVLQRNSVQSEQSDIE